MFTGRVRAEGWEGGGDGGWEGYRCAGRDSSTEQEVAHLDKETVRQTGREGVQI